MEVLIIQLKRLSKREREIELYTFDILPKSKDGNENIVLDLTSDNVLDELRKYPKPDIIVASPMCNSFSRASAMKGGSSGWIINEDETVSIRPKEHYFDKDYNWDSKREYWRFKYEKSNGNAILGKKAIVNTLKIIGTFRPTSWYIENPTKSLLWNFVRNNLGINKNYFNLTHYGAYGFPTKKPTTFMSNINLELRTVEKGYKSEIDYEYMTAKNRSDIPKKLLIDICNKLITKSQNERSQ